MYKRDNKTKETFGDLKENIGHDRLYRRGHDNVQMEMYLVAMGHLIREYHKRKNKKQPKRLRRSLDYLSEDNFFQEIERFFLGASKI